MGISALSFRCLRSSDLNISLQLSPILHAIARSIPCRASANRGLGRCPFGRRSASTVDAGRQPDQVAPRTHELVLRNLRAVLGRGRRLPVARSTLSDALQFLLRRRRRKVRPLPPRDVVTTVAGGSSYLPPTGRRGGDPPASRGERLADGPDHD